MKYEQNGSGVITEVTDEIDIEGAAEQNGAGEWPVSNGSGRTDTLFLASEDVRFL